MKQMLTVLWALAAPLTLLAQLGPAQLAWEQSLGPIIGDVRDGDIDGDGDLDLAFSATTEDRIGWLKNMGNGTYGDLQFIDGNIGSPRGMDLGDLDNDGDLDIAASSWDDDEAYWYENDGTGVFGARILLVDNINNPRWLGIADMTGDGQADILVSQQTEMHLHVGEGAGAFSPGTDITGYVVYFLHVELPDLDQDGDLDVVIMSGSDGILAMLNDGTGQFGELFPVDAFNTASEIDCADINADGLPDVVCVTVDQSDTGGDPGSLHYYLNNGDETFGERVQIDEITLGSTNVVTTDVNGDAMPDVIIGSTEESLVALYLNLGGGTFSERIVLYTGATAVQDVFAADIDGDGDRDVMTSIRVIPGNYTRILRFEVFDLANALPVMQPFGSSLRVHPTHWSEETTLVFIKEPVPGSRIEVVDPFGRVVRTLTWNGSRSMCIARDGLPNPTLGCVQITGARLAPTGAQA